jgi:DnaK suppressor protein
VNFTKEQIVEMRELLDNIREETNLRIEHFVESSKPVSLDGSIGRVTRTDAIQQQQTALTGLRRAREKLVFLDRALRKLDEGTFGECTACGEPIAWKRLKARPDTTLCIECAQGKCR